MKRASLLVLDRRRVDSRRLRRAQGGAHRPRRRRRPRRLAGAVRHAAQRPARQRQDSGPGQQGRRHARRARPLGAAISCSALAAAHGDSLNDTKAIDAAALGHDRAARSSSSSWSRVASKMPSRHRLARPATSRARTACSPRATSSSSFPQGASPAAKDSVRKQGRVGPRAGHRRELRRHGEEVQRRQLRRSSGGDLGVFPRGMMVKPFGDARRRAQAGRDLAARRDAVRLPHHPAQHVGPGQEPVRAAGGRPQRVRSPRAPTSRRRRPTRR